MGNDKTDSKVVSLKTRASASGDALDVVQDGGSIAELEDFADAPVSVAHVRANAAEDGRLWTPRDALIDMLRAIDAGEISPSQLVIAYYEKHDDDTFTAGQSVAGPGDATFVVGLLERVKLQTLMGVRSSGA
jgi:hypothetical protein